VNVSSLSVRAARAERVRAVMAAAGVDVLLLSLGADLPWLTGYHAMPLERLTMLVMPADGEAYLVVPRLEAPRVETHPDLFKVRPWEEWEDPVAIVAALAGAGRGHPGGPGRPVLSAGESSGMSIAVSDRTWATFVLALQAEIPAASWRPASGVTGPLRALKDEAEIAALAAASAAADRVAADLLAGAIPLIGRTERAVSEDIGRRLIAEGHQGVNFAIVGGGPNSASPHHEPGARVIGPGEAVVCDFGGTMDSYCSDITRTVFTGQPPDEFVELYGLLAEAQAAGVAAAEVGIPCQDVDAAARDIIADGGLGAHFVHRTGHGIGLEEHEDPYIVAGNTTPLAAGHAFSVEPGIYIDARFGARIEDIVVATAGGPRPLNRVDHELIVVDA
jgi:Xaa-Pro aminopeptidase